MARQSIRKSSSARTRKALCGGIPMFLRKLTQRIGNSAPWGLIQKFKKRYQQGEVTTINTEPKVTYKYIIGLNEGITIQSKIESIKTDIKLLQDYSTNNWNQVIEDLQIKLYGNGQILNTKIIKPIFDDNIVKLFNTGKLAFIIKIPKSNNESDVYIIHHENNITNYTLVSDYKGPIRIFLYRPQLIMPTNKAQLPKEFQRNTNGLLPHELAALSKSAPHRARPARPAPESYKTNTGQINAFHKPNNYNIANNASLVKKAAKFMYHLIQAFSDKSIVYLDRNADNSGKYLNPIDFPVALSKIKEMPVSSVAIYTIRKSVTSNQSGIPSLIYATKHESDNTKLQIKILQCDSYILKGTMLKPNAFISNLPDNVNYIFGISAVSKPKQPNNLPNTEYADPQNAAGTGNLPPHEHGYMDISKAEPGYNPSSNITLDTNQDLFTVNDESGRVIHLRALPYSAKQKTNILNNIAKDTISSENTLCSGEEILNLLSQKHTNEPIKTQIDNIKLLQLSRKLIYLYADEDDSTVKYMDPKTESVNDKFNNNNTKIQNTVKYVVYAYKQAPQPEPLNNS